MSSATTLNSTQTTSSSLSNSLLTSLNAEEAAAMKKEIDEALTQMMEITKKLKMLLQELSALINSGAPPSPEALEQIVTDFLTDGNQLFQANAALFQELGASGVKECIRNNILTSSQVAQLGQLNESMKTMQSQLSKLGDKNTDAIKQIEDLLKNTHIQLSDFGQNVDVTRMPAKFRE